MSIIIRIKNKTFSNTALPALEQTAQGFLAGGLQGLYLMEEGVVGSAYTGAFIDSSGKGRHASRVGDWVAPTKRSFGMESVGTNGLMLETPILMSPSLTWIFVGRHASPTVTGYPAFFGPSGITATNNAAGANAVERDFIINSDLSGGGNDWSVYHTVGWPAGSNRPSIPSTVGTGNTPTVVGVSFDNVTGKLICKTQKSGARLELLGNAGMMSEWVTTTEKVRFGVWRYQDPNQVVAGEVMLAACYNIALTEAQLDSVMATAKARVAARGVTFA